MGKQADSTRKYFSSKALLQNKVRFFKRRQLGAVVFFVELFLVGVGFRFFIKEGFAFMDLGFSHQIKLQIPEGVWLMAAKGKVLCFGFNKCKLKQFVQEIRDMKRPDPYKGKGFIFSGEEIKLKVGKKR
jgi:large subunit ribosomal protein L6